MVKVWLSVTRGAGVREEGKRRERPPPGGRASRHAHLSKSLNSDLLSAGARVHPEPSSVPGPKSLSRQAPINSPSSLRPPSQLQRTTGFIIKVRHAACGSDQLSGPCSKLGRYRDGRLLPASTLRTAHDEGTGPCHFPRLMKSFVRKATGATFKLTRLLQF